MVLFTSSLFLFKRPSVFTSSITKIFFPLASFLSVTRTILLSLGFPFSSGLAAKAQTGFSDASRTSIRPFLPKLW